MLPALAMIVSAYCIARLIQVPMDMFATAEPRFRTVTNVTVLIVNIIAIGFIAINVADIISAATHTGNIPGLDR